MYKWAWNWTNNEHAKIGVIWFLCWTSTVFSYVLQTWGVRTHVVSDETNGSLNWRKRYYISLTRVETFNMYMRYIISKPCMVLTIPNCVRWHVSDSHLFLWPKGLLILCTEYVHLIFSSVSWCSIFCFVFHKIWNWV